MDGNGTSNRADKVRALGEQLDGYVMELAEQMKAGKSERLIHYLEFAASFHHYSFGNLMLIFGQRPNASQVAGLRQWNKLGRRVLSGEKGIMIMAPMAVWKRGDNPHEPASEEETIESERNETREKITIFKTVYVFDVSQTEGESLPELDVARGDVGDCLPALQVAIDRLGITLEEAEIVAASSAEGAAYGGKIVIKRGLSDAEAFAVTVHELAHELLHFRKENKIERPNKTIREVEADATAFVVGRHFGIECASSDYLLLYDAKPELLLERLETIRKTANRIIDAIEAEMQEVAAVGSATA